MSAHFLLTTAARTLSLASVARMSDEEAERIFVRLRWSDNNGDAYCPHCGCLTVYACRRPNGAPRWRCKACRKDFSVTSGTLFAFHKMPLRAYLMAVAIFCNEVKGKSMLALSRDLGTQYKTAFVLAHKIREAMAAVQNGERAFADRRWFADDLGIAQRDRWRRPDRRDYHTSDELWPDRSEDGHRLFQRSRGAAQSALSEISSTIGEEFGRDPSCQRSNGRRCRAITLAKFASGAAQRRYRNGRPDRLLYARQHICAHITGNLRRCVAAP
jgi:transposase-like protein